MTREQFGHWQDALVFGPFAVYSGQHTRHPYFRAALTIAGIATTLYGLAGLVSPEGRQAPESPLAGASVDRRSSLRRPLRAPNSGAAPKYGRRRP